MKIISKLIIVSLLTYLLFSCKEESVSNPIANPCCVFNGKITLIDSNGANPLNGKITMDLSNPRDFSGNWEYEDGQTGKLIGTISKMKIEMVMNQEMIENITYLYGDFDGKRITGKWIHSGVQGIVTNGTFSVISF